MRATAPNAAGVVTPEAISSQLQGIYQRQGDLYSRQKDVVSQGEQELKALRSQPMPPMPQMEPLQAPPKPLPAKELAENMPFYVLMSVLGGLGTRQPLLNATRAMTSAIEGYHKGDMEGFKTHLETWDRETKYALEKNQQLREWRKDLLDARDKTLADKEYELELKLKELGLEDKGMATQAKSLESMLGRLDKHEENMRRFEDTHERMKLMMDHYAAMESIARDRNDIQRTKAQAAADGGMSQLSPKAQEWWARYLSIGGKPMPYMGRSPAIMKVAEHMATQGSPEEYLSHQNETAANLAAGKAFGTREANLLTLVYEAKDITPLALSASADFDRTNFPKVNQALEAYAKQTGDPKIIKLGQYTQALINLSAQVMSRGGVSTDSARQIATDKFSEIFSHEQYQAAVEALTSELDAIQSAPEDARKELMRNFVKNLGGTSAPANSSTKSVHEMTDDELEAELKALENGHQ